jgi:hypothetical protein
MKQIPCLRCVFACNPFEGGEYTKFLYLHGLRVDTAEARAKLHHKKIREDYSKLVWKLSSPAPFVLAPPRPRRPD